MGGLIALALLLGVLLGWKIRQVWGLYKVRKHFERMQWERERARLRELEEEFDRRERRISGTDGWTK